MLGKIFKAVRSAAKGLCSGIKSILGRRSIASNEVPSKDSKRTVRKNSIVKNAALYEYNGEKLSVKEWARRLSIAEETLRWRIRKYGTLEIPKESKQLLDYKEASIEKTEDGIVIIIDGKRWGLPEFAKSYGVKYHTLANRILKGKPIKEVLAAVQTPQRDYVKNPGGAAKLWEWKGERHTAQEWADIYGIQLSMMRRRLRLHGNPERNCDRLEAYKANRAKRYAWNGEEHTIAEWSQITGKSESALRSSLKKYGSPYAPTRQKNTKTIVPPAPMEQKDEVDASDESDGEMYGFGGEWHHIGEWARAFGLTNKECKENFLKYGEPTRPFISIEGETQEDDLDERKIDMLLKECEIAEKPRVNIKEWLRKVVNEPDDGTPLKDILGIKDHYHTLDSKIPKRQTRPLA